MSTTTIELSNYTHIKRKVKTHRTKVTHTSKTMISHLTPTQLQTQDNASTENLTTLTPNKKSISQQQTFKRKQATPTENKNVRIMVNPNKRNNTNILDQSSTTHTRRTKPTPNRK